MAAAKPDAVGNRGRRRPCERCGLVHERCTGHANVYENDDFKAGVKIGEKPCGKWPMHGQSVCSTHGGRGRNREAGARQWAKERQHQREMNRLENAVKTLGLPVEMDPQQALLEEIARTAGHVRWLGERIGALNEEDLAWGTFSEEHRTGVGEMATKDSPGIDLTTTVKQARPAVLVELYQKERAHLVHVAKVAIQCGIAERQIKLAEEQGQMIAQALRSAFEDPELQLSAAQVEIARMVASKVLRTLSMASANPRLAVIRQLPQPNGE